MSEDKKENIIYILTNPSFPNYVKIGKTTDIQQRLKSLNNPTCLPFSFRIYATYKVEKNLDVVEKAIHNLIDKIDYDLRAREKTDSGRLREREFFALTAENAYEILREIAVLRSDEDKLIIFKQTKKEKDEEKIAIAVEKHAEKAKPLPLSKYGIPIGGKLVFVRNPSFIATVINDKQVEFEGAKYSLSKLAANLLSKYHGWKNTASAQGPLYFMYNGKKLSEIREDINKIDDNK